jgi:GNAT superfamily N-acetyltransferase
MRACLTLVTINVTVFISVFPPKYSYAADIVANLQPSACTESFKHLLAGLLTTEKSRFEGVRASVAQALGFSPIIKESPGNYLKLFSPTGQTIGEMKYTYRNQQLQFDEIFVEESYQKKNIGKYLLGKVLEQYPDIKSIRVWRIDWDNRREFDRLLSEGHTPKEALEKTPVHMLEVFFGFREIVEINENGPTSLGYISRRP